MSYAYELNKLNINQISYYLEKLKLSFKNIKRQIRDEKENALREIEEQTNAKVSVYPNPSDEIINVLNANGETIRIFNTLGQLVISTKNPQISLKNGVYFVKVGESTTRVIIR